ncbi:hypothetical protein ACFPOI_16180 [Nonomuraea angiospora]|uniref:Uncharacterized protein n=1 Tax=Nonomuraea angiospora TaxID=46172 RepID=A0ABR9MGX9_9ACTN|nr:hypothetical protein [Nonomuraea angiospora]MBE1592171.1 hypothetical protein [Nonomuraea angiospora]
MRQAETQQAEQVRLSHHAARTVPAARLGERPAQDARASIRVDDDHPLFAFVAVEGRATLIEDLLTVRQRATR